MHIIHPSAGHFTPAQVSTPWRACNATVCSAHRVINLSRPFAGLSQVLISHLSRWGKRRKVPYPWIMTWGYGSDVPAQRTTTQLIIRFIKKLNGQTTKEPKDIKKNSCTRREIENELKNSWPIKLERFSTNILLHHSFAPGTIKQWNSIPDCCANSSTKNECNLIFSGYYAQTSVTHYHSQPPSNKKLNISIDSLSQVRVPRQINTFLVDDDRRNGEQLDTSRLKQRLSMTNFGCMTSLVLCPADTILTITTSHWSYVLR